jgi:hypothetical protein
MVVITTASGWLQRLVRSDSARTSTPLDDAELDATWEQFSRDARESMLRFLELVLTGHLHVSHNNAPIGEERNRVG